MPSLDAVDRYRIQKVQNSCLRLIYGVRRRNHISPFLLESGWLNMFNRSKLHMATLYFKILKFKSPPYLFRRIVYRTDVHNLNLRRRGILTVPQHRKEVFKRSFSYNIACVMNSFENIDLNQSPLSFKNKYKKRLLQLQQWILCHTGTGYRFNWMYFMKISLMIKLGRCLLLNIVIYIFIVCMYSLGKLVLFICFSLFVYKFILTRIYRRIRC